MNSVIEAATRRIEARRYASTDVYRYYVLGLLVLLCVFSWTDRQIFSIVLQAIKQQFAFSDTQMGLLGGTAFGLFYASVGLPIAWLADRYSRRFIVSAALGLWSVMTCFSGAAGGFASLFLARMGVGIGEAGGGVPAQSLVSDYFPPERRAFAMAVLFTHVPLGYFIALLGGGWANDAFGWRATFMIFGVPGVLCALLILMTLKDPRRGQSEAVIPQPAPTPSLPSTLRYFLSRPSLRHLPLAGAIHGIGGWAAAVWVPTYFMRTYGMSSLEAGTRLAFVLGGAGVVGALAGGYLADRLATRRNEKRWYMWVPATGLIASIPFTIMMFLWPTAQGALLCYIVPVITNHMLLGPVVATTQSLAGVRRRAMGGAFYLFLANLIAMGLGPLIAGTVSDMLRTVLGEDSLRYALLWLVSGSCLWAAIHLLLAARTLKADLAVAESTN